MLIVGAMVLGLSGFAVYTASNFVQKTSAAAVYNPTPLGPIAQSPFEFYTGHTHLEGETIDAPQHSGGTDRYGCHNASVPYHCH